MLSGCSFKHADEQLKNNLSNGLVDDASSYRIVGTDPLKPKNIITVQQVSGLYHADLIARFETTHSIKGLDLLYLLKHLFIVMIPKRKLPRNK